MKLRAPFRIQQIIAPDGGKEWELYSFRITINWFIGLAADYVPCEILNVRPRGQRR